MGLIFYSTDGNQTGKKVQEVIAKAIPGKKLELLESIEALSQRLQQPLRKPDIAVLHVASRQELSSLLSLNDYLRDLRLILILPDRDATTVAEGHRLRPRFMSDCESDHEEIGIVLKRMVQKSAPGLSA